MHEYIGGRILVGPTKKTWSWFSLSLPSLSSTHPPTYPHTHSTYSTIAVVASATNTRSLVLVVSPVWRFKLLYTRVLQLLTCLLYSCFTRLLYSCLRACFTAAYTQLVSAVCIQHARGRTHTHTHTHTHLHTHTHTNTKHTH